MSRTPKFEEQLDLIYTCDRSEWRQWLVATGRDPNIMLLLPLPKGLFNCCLKKN